MKTIFDKVDPKYLECTTGICEHTEHSFNPAFIIAAVVFIILLQGRIACTK